MSKKYSTIPFEKIVKMSPQEIGKQDNKLLFHTYQRMRDTALKRLSRLLKAGFANTNAYKEYKDTIAVKPSTMSEKEIKKGLIELRAFLENEQTKVSYHKKHQKNLQELLNLMHNDEYKNANSARLKLFGDFMDTIRANSSFFLVYDESDLEELWSLYKQNPNETDFTNSSIFKKAFEKFLNKENTLILTDTRNRTGRKKESTKKAEKRRLNRIKKNRKK